MSQQNVDLTYRAVEAFNRRDLDAYLTLIDAQVEFNPRNVWAEGGDPYRGHDGVRTWWAETFDVLPGITAELYEVRDLGATTLVHGHLRGKGLASGAPLTGRCGWPSNGATGSRSGGATSGMRRKPSKLPSSALRSAFWCGRNHHSGEEWCYSRNPAVPADRG